MQFAKFAYRLTKSAIWHIDATASVINPVNEKAIYYYAVVMAKEKGIPALPLYEFVTDLHNVGNLKTAFIAWWGDMSAVGVQPDMIVVDLSWALIHSCLFVFCGESIDEHIQRLCSALQNSNHAADKPRLRLCASHFIKAVSRRLSKHSVAKEVGQFKWRH